MRPTLVCLLLSAPLAADPEKPAEFTKEELATLWKGSPPDREAIYRKYDGRLMKLVGEPQAHEVVELWLAGRPKGVEGFLPVVVGRATDPAGKELAKAIRQQGRTATVYGRASFSREVERPTKEYVVPAGLRPKAGTAGATEDIRESFVRIQQGVIEADELREKILADARKKGQTEKVTVYGLFSLDDAATDPKKVPPAKK